ncbi:hypothetical protein, partial [Escherichia coli]|uniref:hypothetical protein n=1 Tax=Escherichia coli TaxID=562 RepID=UPI0013D3D9F6
MIVDPKVDYSVAAINAGTAQIVEKRSGRGIAGHREESMVDAIGGNCAACDLISDDSAQCRERTITLHQP